MASPQPPPISTSTPFSGLFRFIATVPSDTIFEGPSLSPPPPLIREVGRRFELWRSTWIYGTLAWFLFKSCFGNKFQNKLKYKKGFKVLRVHKILTFSCIILLFLFKGEKRKRSHIGKISNYLWEKENCLNELENMDDSEIINFSNLADRFNCRNVSDI